MHPATSSTPPSIALPAAFAPAGCSVRAATAADVAFERILFGTARSDAAMLATWPAEMREPFLDQQFRFQTAHYARFYPCAFRAIVEAHCEPVGRFILDCGAEEWCVVDIALLPAWRGRGLGGALLRAMQAEAAKTLARVVLTVEVSSPARRLYERLGFAVTEQALPSVGMVWRPV